MKHLGDFDAAAVIYGKFSTAQPSTGASFSLAGTPALSVYKDASTTESTTGVTLTADFDSRTGLNHFAIDTSADGTFYSAGSFFDVVITAGTVDGVSVVGAVVASFTLRKSSALKPATAGRTLVVDAAGLADANVVKLGPTGAGTAQTARDVGGNVDTTVSSRLASGSYTAPSNSDITAIKAKTDNLPASPAAVSDIPTANANADALLDRSNGVETSWTLRQALRIILSACAGKLSGAATSTVSIRDMADSKNRIVATVDTNGNRSAVTRDAT